ncbi:hypothetical protein NEFER03_0871 [Nematocida sp. LUAm3]|nr:hypothetical protein NEFER03_0871 [Nematocida sp. LUAm3]KAI5174889.1 hypothetical protein NEFER02_0989 [Nematocida sp. LUAm2]KAI5177513.1 hypothetical protein NEFER01_0763 [Nematocida sp. LUAm1]
MANAFNKELYREYVKLITELGIVIPDSLEVVYRRYIIKQMETLPYIDIAVTRMYTLVFFLKYIKKMEGSVKFRHVYSKIEVQKKLIARAMDCVEIDFNGPKDHPTILEDWSTLYSITAGIGAGIKNISISAEDN